MLAIVCYGGTLKHPFIFDDLGGIVENPAIRAVWPLWAPAGSPPDTTPFGRPITALTLAFNYLLGGLSPFGYHLLNIILHAGAACAVLNLATILVLSGEKSTAWIPKQFPFAVASIWLVHPLCTSAVTYIVQRAEVLMVLCYLGTLICAAKYCRSTKPESLRFWIWAIAVSSVGMMCKESMVTAPVAALLMDRAFFSPTWSEIWARRKAFYISLASTWLVLAVCMIIWPRSNSVGFRETSLGSMQYLLMQMQVIPHYLWLVVSPVGLSLDYAWPRVSSLLSVLPQLFLLTGMGTAILVLWFRQPWLAWLVAMPFLVLVPTSSVVPVITAIASEHRMYLPTAFLVALACLLVAAVVEKVPDRLRIKQSAFDLFTIATVVLLAHISIQRNTVYATAESIWRDVLVKQPNNARALNNLGFAVWREGRVIEAEGFFARSLEKEAKNADALYNLGTLYGQRGETEKAIEFLARAIKIWPDYAAAYANLGVVYFLRGETQKGFEAYQSALRYRPEHVVANFNMAVIRFQRGELSEAEKHIRIVVARQPGYPKARELFDEIRRLQQK